MDRDFIQWRDAVWEFQQIVRVFLSKEAELQNEWNTFNEARRKREIKSITTQLIVAKMAGGVS